MNDSNLHNGNAKEVIVCFGEVLFDVFPNKKLIGGAPLNVALRLKSLGASVEMISSVGEDSDGTYILNHIKSNGIRTAYVQRNAIHTTGSVEVSLKDGLPSYNILEEVAWDYIQLNNEISELVVNSSVLVFGSLVCRSPVSKSTLKSLIAKASFSVFDVNLRTPYYSQGLIQELIQSCDFLKCNADELNLIVKYYQIRESTLESRLRTLSNHIGLNYICVTEGKKGASLLFKGEFYHSKGFPIQVADTVGAGDSFLAVLVYHLFLSGKLEPKVALNRACALGALVASKHGANPIISDSELESLIC